MKLFLFSVILVLVSAYTSAQSPSFAWVKAMGGALRETPAGIDLDANGNIYITGSFQGTTDFDPGPGTNFLSSPGGVSTFACKLDAQGNLLWAKQIGAVSTATGSNVKSQGQALSSNGDLYITGNFAGQIDFDPGLGSTTFTSAADDIFIAKLDAQGNFLWAKQVGGFISDYGNAIAIDAANAIYCTGFFMGAVDFDPSPVNSYPLTGTPGTPEVFVLKLDASGNFGWACQMSTSGGTASAGAVGYGITLDNNGNVYSTGTFMGKSDFDPGSGTYTLTAVGAQDVYVWKLGPTGNFLLARTFGGTTIDGGNDIITDVAGNILVTGFFTGSGDFDPGLATYSLTSAGSYDFFISKFDAQGNLIWVKGIGGSGNDATSMLALDATGNVYSTGIFENTVDFDPGPGTYTLSTSFENAFIFKLDALGNFKWAKHLAGSTYSGGNDITVDPSTNVFTTGSFSSTTDFDPNTGTYTLTPVGMEDVFIHKMACGSSPDINAATNTSIMCAGNNVTLTASGASSYTWNTNVSGSLIIVNPTITTTYTLDGTDANGCHAGASITQNVNACTAINQINASSLTIRVSPNPSNGLITIDLDLLNSDETTINLANSLGQTVMIVNSKNQQIILSTEQFPAGIYFLTAFHKSKQYGPVKLVRE